MKCYRHPLVDSVHSCANCLKAVCNGCLVFEGSRELCPPCKELISRGSRVRGLVIGAAIAGVVVGAVGFAYAAMKKHPKPPPRVSKELPPPVSLGEQWKAKLAKEPCDRKLAMRAAQELLKDNAARDTIAVVDNFYAKCPPLPRLLWEKYTAHERIGEFDKAAEAATKLIESDPDDQDFYWWRGKMLAASNKHAEAENDFVQALTILPNANHIPFDLADTYEKLKRPCDALRVLQDYSGYHPFGGSYPALEARFARLERDGNCGSVAGQGKIVRLKFPPKASTIPVRAKFNDATEGLFVVDTGASMVVLTRKFADKLGIPDEKPTLWVTTANGRTQVQLASVDVIDVRGARARRVPVVVADTFNDGTSDGLLGMGFLGRFDVRVSAGDGLLEIAPRKANAGPAAPEARELR